MFSELTDTFSQSFQCRPLLGLEVEFYLRSTDIVQAVEPQIRNDAFRQACQNNGLTITEERGINQFELTIDYTSPAQLVTAYTEKLAQIHNLASQQGLLADFTPKPYVDDYGSALHLHLSLHAEREGHIEANQNIFASGQTLNDNPWLMHSIGGIMQMIPSYLEKFCNADDYLRFQPQFMAPSHFAWGGNNRTTIIRLPDAKPQHRRLEFRLPSASAPLHEVIIFILTSVLNGLHQQTQPPARIYGNAFDPQYGLPRLPQNPAELASFKLAVAELLTQRAF